MPHGLRRADYWLYPWQIRAIQRLAERDHTTPSAALRDLLTAALPASLRPASLESNPGSASATPPLSDVPRAPHP